MQDISAWLEPLRREIAEGKAEPKPFDKQEYDRRFAHGKRAAQKKFKQDHIGLLDFETEPFDAAEDAFIEPFICCLYYGGDYVIFHDENADKLIDKIFAHIEALDEPWIFYAHNGGKFDFRFMEHKLRGRVNYKGSSLMRAEIGKCEIRDSLHILPIALKEYNKEKFDYWKLKKAHRAKYMDEIIAYVKSDCENTLRLIRKFIEKNGFKISVGAAALAMLRKEYDIEHITPTMDDKLRPYFRGGRVECLAGAGYFEADEKPFLYIDANSMYPDRMANCRHPIGSQYIFRTGLPNADTFFITLECDNYGALIDWDEENQCVTSQIRHGIFRTTIHEYNAAIDLNLIENVRIIECVDNLKSSDFSRFVVPRYADRQQTKHELQELKKTGDTSSEHYFDVHGEDLLIKLELNNAYGKTAQNPRKFREYVYTDPTGKPDENEFGTGWTQDAINSEYCIWSRPNPDIKFLNVGTGASITGAARAKLLYAIAAAKNPFYCDTDSIICEGIEGVEMDNEKLGAWKIEDTISKLIVAGKKLYAYENTDGKKKFRSKGSSGWNWEDMLALLQDREIIKVNPAPTLTRGGGQRYVSRTIRRTGQTYPLRIGDNSNVEFPTEGRTKKNGYAI